jgi:hypothetical protein
VFQELAEKHIEAFLPTYKVHRRWSDRYKVIDEQLFKNYPFVNVEYDRRYYDTLRPYGAVGFVVFDGNPPGFPRKRSTLSVVLSRASCRIHRILI